LYSPIVLVALIKIITLLVLNSFHEGFCFVDVKDVLITKYSNNSVMWANVVIGSVVVVLLSMAVYCNKSMRPMPIRTIQTNGWDKRLSTQALFFAFSFVLCLFFVVHFFDINLDSIWRYHSYLRIANPDFCGLKQPLAIFTHRNLVNLLLILAAVISTCLLLRNYPLALFAAVPFCYAFTYAAAQHSRAAPLSILVIALTGLFCIKRYKYLFVALAFMSVLLYFHCLGLRGTKQGEFARPNFGLCTYFENTLDPIKYDGFTGSIEFALVNVFSGGLNLARYLDNGAQVQDSGEYKVKSFSPLPSLVDGFSSIRDVHQIRISSYMPLSSYAELVSFGVFFFIPYFATFFLVLYFNANIMSRSLTLGGISSAPFFFACIYMGSYPVRHTYKFIVISGFLCLAAFMITQSKRNSSSVQMGAKI